MEKHSSNYTVYSKKIPHIFCDIVIFTGGEFPAPAMTENYWKIHKPDYVIAADSGVDTALKFINYFKQKSSKLNFCPNLILGDFDSISDKAVLQNFIDAEIKKFDTYKDFTDTELAVEAAYAFAKKNYKRKNVFITLVGGSGDRLDHTLAIYDSFSSAHHVDAWLGKNEACYLLKKGNICEIKKLTTKDIVSVARTSKSRTLGKIISCGLEWEADVFRKKGLPSLSNKINCKRFAKKHCVELSAIGADFLVILPHSSVFTIQK